jgi:hypothetical protein
MCSTCSRCSTCSFLFDIEQHLRPPVVNWHRRRACLAGANDSTSKFVGLAGRQFEQDDSRCSICPGFLLTEPWCFVNRFASSLITRRSSEAAWTVELPYGGEGPIKNPQGVQGCRIEPPLITFLGRNRGTVQDQSRGLALAGASSEFSQVFGRSGN